MRVARSWQVGQKNKNNGAVLFVFVQEHKMFLQVGYGLEGVLPDALCKRIIDEQISPRFKAGDFDGGLTAGVQAILAATKGEYKGTGTTVAERQTTYVHHSGGDVISSIILILLVILFLYFRFFFLPLGGIFYSGSGRSAAVGAAEEVLAEAVDFQAAVAREGDGNYAPTTILKTSAPRRNRCGDPRGRAENLRRNPHQHQPQTR